MDSKRLKRKQLNVRIPEYHMEILTDLAQQYGLSQSQVIMLLLTEKSAQEKVLKNS